MGASCDSVLDAELLIEPVAIKHTLEDKLKYSVYLDNKHNDSAMMQFYIPKGVDRSEITVESSCADNCTIFVYVIAGENLASTVANSSLTIVPFRSHENAIHHVLLRIHSGVSSNVSVTLQESVTPNKDYLNKVDLVRRSFTDFFLFDYDHIVGNDTKPSSLNLTADTLSVLKFEIGSVYDVGGTVSVGLKFVKDELVNKKVVAVGCVSLGRS